NFFHYEPHRHRAFPADRLRPRRVHGDAHLHRRRGLRGGAAQIRVPQCGRERRRHKYPIGPRRPRQGHPPAPHGVHGAQVRQRDVHRRGPGGPDEQVWRGRRLSCHLGAAGREARDAHRRRGAASQMDPCARASPWREAAARDERVDHQYWPGDQPLTHRSFLNSCIVAL
ncbi:hypothetical protein DFH09DRAFT_357990, partial [Mycena vulgaris]